MIEPSSRGGGVMRAGHYVVLAAVTVVALVVAFAVFSFVVGIVFEIIKIAVVIAIVLGAFWVIARIARKR